MKLISWNVNGIRSVEAKGFSSWFSAQGADIICLQEVKALPEQLGRELLHPRGYHSFWNAASRPGYSGVAMYCRREPERIRTGLGVPEIDSEGRVQIAEIGNLTLVNAYFPNSRRDHSRLPYKLLFCERLLDFLEAERARGRHVVICGDYNIAHREIDLKNPKTNQKNAGFLPEERSWMDRFVAAGYVDTFRELEPGPGHYTWWSYRPGVRERNIGWRLDYFFTNQELRDRFRGAGHQAGVMGSDHCPVWLELKN